MTRICQNGCKALDMLLDKGKFQGIAQDVTIHEMT